MTDQEQRIAIAKWMGLIDEADQWHENPLPDYTRDLNAMHEAESKLGENHWWKYTWLLTEDMHTTAAQRAEALLRTLGLWTE